MTKVAVIEINVQRAGYAAWWVAMCVWKGRMKYTVRADFATPPSFRSSTQGEEQGTYLWSPVQLLPNPVCTWLFTRDPNYDLFTEFYLCLGVTRPCQVRSSSYMWHRDTGNLSEFSCTRHKYSQLHSTHSCLHQTHLPGLTRPRHPVLLCWLMILLDPTLISRPTSGVTNKAWPSLVSPIYPFPNLQAQARWHILYTNSACCTHIRHTIQDIYRPNFPYKNNMKVNESIFSTCPSVLQNVLQ